MNDYLRIPVPIKTEAGTTPPMTPHKICRKCKYVGLLSGNDKNVYCNYMEMAGRRREYDGAKCLSFEEAPRRKRVRSLTFK